MSNNTDSSSSSNSIEKRLSESEMDFTPSNIDFSSLKKQEARAFLRERFLRIITGVIGKPANFQLYENTSVKAEFRGCDIDFINLYVRNLTTPLGTVPEAMLRTSDVILMEMEEV